MARTALTVTRITRTANGYSETAGLVAVDQPNGNSFANTGREFLIVDNGTDDTALTVTILSPVTVDGLAVTDLAATVALGVRRIIGPFPPSVYGSEVSVDWSSGTDIKACVVKAVAETD